MTRLSVLPPHLTGTPTYEADPHREALVGELRTIRHRLSQVAGRLAPTRTSIEAEVRRVEALCERLRELAGRL